MQEHFTYNPKDILIITVQAPTALKPQNIYELSSSNDLPSDHTPSVVNHKINHKYPKLLHKPILNKAHTRIYIPQWTIFRTLEPVQTENVEICITPLTKFKNLNKNTMENLDKICQYSWNNNELSTTPLESSFQPELSNHNR